MLKVRPAGAGPLSAKVSAALASTSVATTEPDRTAASSATLTLAAWATGASLVPVTVMTEVGGDACLVVGDRVRHGEHGGLADTQRLVGRVGGIEAVGAVSVEGQAGRGRPIEREGQRRIGIDVGGDDRTGQDRGILGDADAGGLGHRRVVGAGDGDDQVGGDVAPSSSVTVYGTVSTADWPTPSDW